VFVDTNIFVGALNRKDSDHKLCRLLLESVFEKHDWLYTSDYILDECFTVAWSKTRKQPKAFRHSLIRRLDGVLQGSQKIVMLKVDEEDFSSAKAYLRKYPRTIPTLTDWTSLVLMKRNHISSILSLDGDFVTVRKIPEFQWVRRINDALEL
jgi:predicted nucleic acid-binding protein